MTILARLRSAPVALTTSLWLLPAAIVGAGVALAAALVEVSPGLDGRLLGRYPRLLGAGAEGARGMLSTIAGSMMTVAGVTFSITIAAVAQTSTQYTPRVLRTFMRDRANQAALGAFVGIFAYCLVVLRTIRGADEGAFVPAAAVLGGFLLALVGVGVLVAYIIHVSQSLQAAAIVDRVRRETDAAVDRLFPDALSPPTEETAGAAAPAAPAHRPWRVLRARTSGYVQRVDEVGLVKFARSRDAVVRMVAQAGDFTVAGAPLATMTRSAGADGADGSGASGHAPDRALRAADDEAALNALYTIRRHRTVDQDAAFGLLQISDIALKALSPGVNDTTTAVTCVDQLAAGLARIAPRRLPDPARADAEGVVRVLAAGPTFDALVATALDDVRRSAAGNVTVLARLLQAVETVGACTADPGRRRILVGQAARVAEIAGRTVEAPEDRRMLAARAASVRETLALEPPLPGSAAAVR